MFFSHVEIFLEFDLAFISLLHDIIVKEDITVTNAMTATDA